MVEEPRWRPGRSLDQCAPLPAPSEYPGRRPPRPGSGGRSGNLAGGDRGGRLVPRASLGSGEGRCSVRAVRGADRVDLRRQSRPRSRRARPPPKLGLIGAKGAVHARPLGESGPRDWW
ncbi:hypothetical protein NDU88_007837 [Pleurodeles waltl]|uniref:Uncharacterized protein n=1 Tax=Pleurodeles waltl TaxID=8319 RepID=A0AAV7RRF4_PLEWA|nr:hypothetical protein NDU88_007837 [Pleurodeles waltl]